MELQAQAVEGGGQEDDRIDGGADGGQIELQAQAGGGGGQGEDRIYDGVAGGEVELLAQAGEEGGRKMTELMVVQLEDKF